MRDLVLMRLDGPLMSFGGPIVDNYGVVDEAPGLSMLVGLIANALGWEHRDADRLERLQARLRYAVRRDRAGSRIADYQTVDLGQPFLDEGWTTRGSPEGRKGGEASSGTHIRFRDYLADAVYTVALTLEPAEVEPTLDQVARALGEPSRPLFLGRKCCLPAAPLLLGRVSASSLVEGLRRAPRLAEPRGDRGPLAAWWPASEQGPSSRSKPVTDERDWRNQIHVGRRMVCEGRIELEETGNGN